MSDHVLTKSNVDVGQLHTKISEDSIITKTCIGVTDHPPDSLKIEFDADLPAAEEEHLENLVAEHVPI